MKSLILILSISLLAACSSGGGEASTSIVNTSPGSSYDNIDGVWTLTSSFKCYNSSLTTLTYNGTANASIAKTLVISGQSFTLTMSETISGTQTCDGTYSGNIYPASGLVTISNIALTSTSNSSCVFSYSNPAGTTPSSVSNSVNGATMLTGLSNYPYIISGNVLAIPLVSPKPVGSPSDICFDIYTK